MVHRDSGNRESWEHGYFDIVNPDIPMGVYYCGHIGAVAWIKSLAKWAEATKGGTSEIGTQHFKSPEYHGC